MKKIFLFVVTLLALGELKAQNVGIGTQTPDAKLHVADSSVLFSAINTNNSAGGTLPQGNGSIRFLWYPEKAAIRAGRFGSVNWSKETTGLYSVAMGDNPVASGTGSISFGNSLASGKDAFAAGFTNRAQGNNSVAMGIFAKADGYAAVALGYSPQAYGSSSVAIGSAAQATDVAAVAIGSSSEALEEGALALNGGKATALRSIAINGTASGERSMAVSGASSPGLNSFSFGNNANASGDYAIAIGSNARALGYSAAALGYTEASGSYSFAANRATNAPSAYETVFGTYNTIYTPASKIAWNAADRLFVIGNGTATSERSDAFTVFKNGNVSIMTPYPNARLSVNGDASKSGGGMWSVWSDARLKKNITPYNAGLKEILQINPVRFQYNELSGEEDLDKNYVGIIAQEIEKILPSTISIKKDERIADKRMFDGSELVYTLINAVKEQQQKIDLLQKEIAELKQSVKK